MKAEVTDSRPSLFSQMACYERPFNMPEQQLAHFEILCFYFQPIQKTSRFPLTFSLTHGSCGNALLSPRLGFSRLSFCNRFQLNSMEVGEHTWYDLSPFTCRDLFGGPASGPSWQASVSMRRTCLLLSCMGCVYINQDTEADSVLQGF